MLAFAAERIMEVEAHTGAAKGARSPLRAVSPQQRISRPELWDARAGRIALEISKLRKESYFPSSCESNRTTALVLPVTDANRRRENPLPFVDIDANFLCFYDQTRNRLLLPGMPIVRAGGSPQPRLTDA